jgi:lysophospholipase L1-like esterase
MELLLNFFEHEKQEKVKRLRLLNQYVQKGQIVFAGSSLMEQFPVEEFGQDFPTGQVIYNRGIGGITTGDFLELLEVCIFDLEPAKIFLNIGTNDLNAAEDPIPGLVERYRTILTAIRARLPHARLYLLAYYPLNELDDFGIAMKKEIFQRRTNARVRQANAQVEQLARQFAAQYLDVNAGLVDANGQLKVEYSVEGMHIYPNGYKVVYDALVPYLVA